MTPAEILGAMYPCLKPKPKLPKYILLLALIALFIALMIMRVWAGEPQAEVIASVIAAEAANQGTTGMTAVACTIANRAKLYHKTPYEIVTQKNQYYGYTAKNRQRLYNQVKTHADYLAQNIMQLQDITKGAIYFRQPKEPRYSWHKIETFRYLNHIFYR
jgi:spore germination cell wall hydrolase CwlJ-like protein